MTIAQSILSEWLDDNCVVISESELMSDAADACTECTVWTDQDGHARGSYIFSDGSWLYVTPSGPEVY